MRAVARVKGWRAGSGMLWTPGNLVYVVSPILTLSQNLLIEGVVYTLTGQAAG